MGNSDSKKDEKRKYMSFKQPRTSVSQTNILITKQHAITDDYDLLSKNPRVLGTGINGKVILCQNKNTKKKYALKRLKDSQSARREIELQWRSSLNFLHIVQIKDVYENKVNNDKYLYVILEYMEGGELFDRIKNRKTPFTEHEVGKIFRQIATAVKHLHQLGIAHRDLKPENILLLTKDEKNLLIKISDFGFAKEAHKGLTTPNYTPYYVAPEILKFEKYDISCDIWSLGVILYILCSGTPPFYSLTGKKMSPGMENRILNAEFGFKNKEWLDVSNEAKDLIKKMLEPEPKERLSIDDILNSEWMKTYAQAPKTKLTTISNLKVNNENWDDFRENFGIELKERRIDWDANVEIKKLHDVKNPLYLRRKLKAKSKELIDEKENDSKEEDILVIVKHDNEKNEKIPQLFISSSSAPGTILRSATLPAKSNALTALYYSSNIRNDQKNENDQKFEKSFLR